jgi:hypothetical protein
MFLSFIVLKRNKNLEVELGKKNLPCVSQEHLKLYCFASFRFDANNLFLRNWRTLVLTKTYKTIPQGNSILVTSADELFIQGAGLEPDQEQHGV